MVSIVAVMGSYRTGKSFLLDLMMRYLRARCELEAARAPPEPEPEEKPEERSRVTSSTRYLPMLTGPRNQRQCRSR